MHYSGLRISQERPDSPDACVLTKELDADLLQRYPNQPTHGLRPGACGPGIGRGILAAIEDLAKRAGYRAPRLETGDRQPEAIAFYESTGYRRIGCLGEHTENTHSMCFEKVLK